jgi:ABC-type bacteriocin/lantibiotic exporter with double-glycine peptidase domain
MAASTENPVKRIFGLLKFQKKEISAIYFYAIFSGIVQLTLPLGTQSIINFVMGGFISTSLVILITAVVGGVFVYGLLQINQMKLIEKIEQQIFVRNSFQFTYVLPKLNLKDVDSYYLPELVNRFFDTITLQKSLAKILLEIPTATIQILFGLILLSFYHPSFILFGLALVIVLYLILRFSGVKGLQTSMLESDYKYKVAGWIEELARTVTSFKFSKGTPIHLHKSDVLVSSYLENKTAHFKVLLFQYWTLTIFKVLITASLFIVGSVLLVNQQINIGQFIGAELVILTVVSSVEKLIVNLDKIYEVLVSVEKLAKITDKPLEHEGQMALSLKEEGVSVKVNDLSFTYPDGREAISHISFDLDRGEVMTIQGANSSGKSTLLRMLTGAYQPFDGVININQIAIGNYDMFSLRSQTGILLSKQDIFEGTLLENITMGDPDADMAEIARLCSLTGLNQFTESDQMGFGRMLYPTGKKLPKGVVSKILLVRALSGHPKLLLLEEPWIDMEEGDAAQVKQYLLNHPDKPTTFVVTEDAAFAAASNKVVRLENGAMVGIKENNKRS